jgi:hypothetical protein
MATYSNGGLRVNAGVAFSVTATSGVYQTLYTAPANGYAILQIRAEPGASTTVTITIATKLLSQTVGSTPTSYTSVYVGPSQVVQGTGVSSTTFHVTGVEFING